MEHSGHNRRTALSFANLPVPRRSSVNKAGDLIPAGTAGTAARPLTPGGAPG
jgi:hypothetical protein